MSLKGEVPSAKAPVVFKFKYLFAGILGSVPAWYTAQSASPCDKFFISIQVGIFPVPCPTVALAPVPVYFTIENPLVVLAVTVEYIEPAVLVEPATELPALKLYPTRVFPLPFVNIYQLNMSQS